MEPALIRVKIDPGRWIVLAITSLPFLAVGLGLMMCDHIKRHTPKPGQTWIWKHVYESPFHTNVFRGEATVIAVTNGWVQYRGEYGTNDCPIAVFKQAYPYNIAIPDENR